MAHVSYDPNKQNDPHYNANMESPGMNRTELGLFLQQRERILEEQRRREREESDHHYNEGGGQGIADDLSESSSNKSGLFIMFALIGALAGAIALPIVGIGAALAAITVGGAVLGGIIGAALPTITNAVKSCFGCNNENEKTLYTGVKDNSFRDNSNDLSYEQFLKFDKYYDPRRNVFHRMENYSKLEKKDNSKPTITFDRDKFLKRTKREFSREMSR